MSRHARVAAHALRTLGRNRVRTGFMMFGTFVGVAALTVLSALGQRTQRGVLEQMEQMLSGSSILIRAGGGQWRAGAHGAGPTTTLTLADIAAIDSIVPDVLLADPFIMTNAREVIYGGRSARVPVQGHSAAAAHVWNRPVTRGSYFTARDVANAARVALVGEVVARELFGGRDPIGEQVRIGAVPFQVIGVLARVGVDPHGIDKDDEIIVPVTTLMRRVLNRDYLLGAKLSLSPGADLDAASLEIADVLRARHALGHDQPNDFHLFTPVQVRERVRAANRTFTVLLPLLAGISILVGGVVVANLMLITVAERRREIGLSRAVGARPADIRLQFLLEAGAVTTMAGLLGIGVAYGALGVVTMHGGPRPELPWPTVLLGLGCAILVGLVSGIVPARRAAALDPVQALRG